MPEPVAIKYRAFVSYGHADTAWAKWLHKALEGFSIDKDIAGRETPIGPVPRTLRPIFRDREDFSGGHTLTDATIAALDASAALIVLCSPVAAARPAVNEEVRLFRSRHPGRPVIPVIIAGTWPDNFPPALRYELAADGAVTDRPLTILGPDLRESADGKNLGLAKAVAGLTGIGVDDIFRRAERARRKQARVRNGIIAVLIALTVAAIGSAGYAWHQLTTNEAFLNATLKRATEIVDEAVAQAEKYNVPRAATLTLLGKAEGLFDDMAQYGRATPELRYRKSWMLIQFARNYAILGDTNKQREHAVEAHRLLAGLAAEKPDDLTYQRNLSVALNEVGNVLVVRGNLPQALASFRDGLAIAERLTKAAPTNDRWQHDLSVSYSKIGEVLVSEGNLPAALTSFRENFAIVERLAKTDPNSAGWQRALSVAYNKIGDVLIIQGNLPAALMSFRDGLVIAERLATADPQNADGQRDLSVSYERTGDVLMAQGNLPAALTSFRDSLAVAERLAKADPNNAGWQRDLFVSYSKIGEVLVAQGNLPAALKSFHDSLAVTERLAKADPNNTIWQRDLSVTNDRIGEVLVAQGNLPAALTSFRDSLTVAERLAKADPNNANWQRDLSVSYIRLGEVLAVQGNLASALTSFRNGFAIRERLAKADPNNARWQRDLAVGHAKLASIFRKSDNKAEALAALRKGREIMAVVVKLAPDFAQWKKDLAWFDGQIAGLDGLAQAGPSTPR